ncbi:phenylalanine 4-monooxygenase [Pokkaliibacter sp. MBI-7]|uniref:phenylalanine 4-monooxygenase n=1 Tax=Pokkaliibacter sp. MBI-7 TaxID=3040600 RepID=UPI00244CFEB6|nr:phenylalanine 4-monooxygenase [Pokkaliibacter sp. MBI-7]MDH2434962.1 phenylalanine 4-monooxygenase [Pokkaliibacter sp. MBI-7]
MGKSSRYTAHTADAAGLIHYSDTEHHTWQHLIHRQVPCIQGKACKQYLHGLATLNLPTDRIPQLPEINVALQDTTGWRVTPVPALISFDHFFQLLANREFPVATFIRTPEDMDYLQEPDIFHEIFGHCPLLTNKDFAAFTHTYGRLGYHATKEERVYLARLYWFTIEFGLLNWQPTSVTDRAYRVYGGGILSSIGETEYAWSSRPSIVPFDLLTVLRTPYRIDIMQPRYFLLDSFETLLELSQLDLLHWVRQAQQLGLLPALFETPVSA